MKTTKKTIGSKSVEKASEKRELTAEQFIKKLKTFQSNEELRKYHRYFKFDEDPESDGDKFIGIRMGHVFALAKEFIEMPIVEIEKLLESQIHEIRAGGCSIMGKQASDKNTPESRRKELYDLYIRRHDRINNWDLVDLAAYKVVGSYLVNFNKSRKILYKLAGSKNMWERRTAIVSTLSFVGRGELDDAFKISELLMNEKEDLVHKGIGWVLRSAGQKDRKQLLAFLDKHGAVMPRIALRYAIEHLEPKQRKYYLDLKIKNKK